MTESLIDKMVLSLCHMGEQALDIRDYAHAHHCFTEALKIDPQNKAAWDGKIQSLVKWGDAAGEAGEFDKAHHYYSMAMEISQDDQLIRHKREGAAQKAKRSKSSGVTSVLFLAADPTEASRLRLGEELREIQEKLQLAKLREQFALDQRMSVRPVDLSQALLDVQPQIVHFSGHGTTTGALCFEDQKGQTHPIQADALAALFEQFTDQVDCVVLNACYSEIQANAIAEHIEYVIGMNQAIGDKAAIAFSIGFYQALGAGRTVEEAFQLGCVQIRLQSIPEHLTPVLKSFGLKILKVLSRSRSGPRTTRGIRDDTGLDIATAANVLNILKEKGYVSVKRTNGERWVITALGKKLLEDTSHVISDLSQ